MTANVETPPADAVYIGVAQVRQLGSLRLCDNLKMLDSYVTANEQPLMNDQRNATGEEWRWLVKDTNPVLQKENGKRATSAEITNASDECGWMILHVTT
jgi:hypothetical protein